MRPPSLLDKPSYLAAQVWKYGRRHLELALAERDLALVHHALVSALADFGPLSQQELADSLDIDKSHLVRPLDELEDRGLLERRRDADDRRRNRVALTPAGRRLVDELAPVTRASQEGFLAALSAQEQSVLISLLQRVLAANDAARLAANDR